MAIISIADEYMATSAAVGLWSLSIIHRNYSVFFKFTVFLLIAPGIFSDFFPACI